MNSPMPMSLENTRLKKSFGSLKSQFYFLFATRLSVKDQTLFAKRLSFLVKAGVPILDSLELLKKQTKSKAKVRMYERVISDVANGQFLSTSLGRFQGAFGDFALNIIKVGETSGVLSENLSYLAEELKKKHALKRKVVGALVYPIIITLSTFGMTSFLISYIFPKILPVFKSLHVGLPWSTRFLIFLSDLIRSQGLSIFFLLIALTISSIVAWRKISSLHRLGDRVLLRVPISGAIARDYNLANICRTLGLLLKSGTRVVEAVVITSATTANLLYRQELQRVAEGVVKGQKISKHLEARSDLFPEMMTQLVAVGETTGNLSDTLLYLSAMYESELDEATKNLSSAIEPVLMILMGLIVGFVAISIITPIYQITQNLSH